jgi:hypothetical protein
MGLGAITNAQPEGPVVCVFRLVTGLPSPFCGTTRSLFELGQADLSASVQMSPLGVVAALAAVGVLARLAMARRSRPARLWPPAVLAVGGIAVLLSWVSELTKGSGMTIDDPNRGGDGPGQPRPEAGQAPVPPAHAYQSRPNAPGAVAALVLGILGLTICSICAPFAWWQGQKARAAVDQPGGTLDGRGMATAGWITGIIGTVILIIVIVVLVVALAAGGVSA